MAGAVDTSTTDGLKTYIRDIFAAWQFVARELPNVEDAQLRNPKSIVDLFSKTTTPEVAAKDYITYLLTIVDVTLSRADDEIKSLRTEVTRLSTSSATSNAPETEALRAEVTRLNTLLANAPETDALRAEIARLNTLLVATIPAQISSTLQSLAKTLRTPNLSRLEHLGDLCQKTKRDMVAAMKVKFTDDLRTLIRQDVNPCALDDVDGWRTKFQVWSQNIIRENNHYFGTSKTYITKQYQQPVAAPQVKDDPMDFDAINTRKQNIKEQERRCGLGLCHYCKEPDHAVWDCEAKKQADALRNSRNNNGVPNQRNNGTFGECTQSYQPRPQSPSTRGGYQRRFPFEYQQNNSYPGTTPGYQRSHNSSPNPQSQGFQRQHQLNNFQGYVEEESLTPDESASNTTSRITSPSGSFRESGNA
ncbi:hypothetical protein SBOR_9735 [Sclerotinia borealis F-4128]|uniref:CCHC-type domain-containing protein n=1 Tax=Sclerotinia borealis (strain F-4128) TaxID=1432307 RepID=W9C1X8_SCLBF|nr:hypothetical protein SBOR_9735 [Sclerotinia borealis F-4128]